MPSPWSVSVAAVIGTGHRKSGLPCQDDARWRTLGDPETLIIAVSDGAGSGRLTDLASAVAVRSCCHFLENRRQLDGQLDATALRDAASRAVEDLHRLHAQFTVARASQFALRDFACTLILLSVQGSTLSMLQIGDGAVVTSTAATLSCLSPKYDAEYVNERTFLASDGALARAYTVEVDATDIRAIAAMTDGVQHLGINHSTNEPFAGLFQPLFEYAMSNTRLEPAQRNEQISTLLDSDDVNSRTDDDKTLVVAVRALG